MATNMLKNKKKHTVYQLQLKAIKIYTRRSLLKTLIEWDFTLKTDEQVGNNKQTDGEDIGWLDKIDQT